MSAKTLTADALDERLQQFVAGIRWPTTRGAPAPVAEPIKSCPSPLAYTKARLAKPDGADMLLSLFAGVMPSENSSEAPVERHVWCRDGESTTQFGVYRSDPDAKSYVLALYDAGRVVNVAPSLAAMTGKGHGYTVSLTDVDGSVSAFPSFASLPQPAQVFDLIAAGQSSATAKGNTVTIDAKALE